MKTDPACHAATEVAPESLRSPSLAQAQGMSSFGGLSADFAPRDLARLHRHWQRTPLRLDAAGLAPGWPGSDQWVQWMRGDRLRSAQARLWRSPAGATAGKLQLDPRTWTHERRLGGEVLDGLLNAGAVERELSEGAWLQLQHLHRLDAGVARLMSRWQQALGIPLRAHGWRGRARPAGPARTSAPAARIKLDPADAAAARFVFVIEGEMTVAWSSSTATATAADAAASRPARRRRLRVGCGDVLYLPAAQSLAWSTHGSVWAVELCLVPLTPLAVLEELGAGALARLGEDPALRRCVRDPALAASAGSADDPEACDAGRLRQLLQAALPPRTASLAAQRHLARIDEDRLASSGRLGALSRLFEADAQTRLVGRPEGVLRSHQSAGRLTLGLARKELHFDTKAAELLGFLLQPRPYRLADAPGRFALFERLQLARRLAVEGLVATAV